MNIITHRPLDLKIVTWGMSCSGKTTFSKAVSQTFGWAYHCFDADFHWHLVETLGLSPSLNLKHVRDLCKEPQYVLDGWHLSDREGALFPEGAAVYVVWAPYETIISQYRIPVGDPDEHREMYRKWYLDVDFSTFPGVRYFRASGFGFVEVTADDFVRLSGRSR